MRRRSAARHAAHTLLHRVARDAGLSNSGCGDNVSSKTLYASRSRHRLAWRSRRSATASLARPWKTCHKAMMAATTSSEAAGGIGAEAGRRGGGVDGRADLCQGGRFVLEPAAHARRGKLRGSSDELSHIPGVERWAGGRRARAWRLDGAAALWRALRGMSMATRCGALGGRHGRATRQAGRPTHEAAVGGGIRVVGRRTGGTG